MTASLRRAMLTVFLASTLGAAAALAQDLPAHVGKVNDFAELLDPSQRDTLDMQLAELERTTSAEVAVVTLHSLGGQTVEEYAVALFDAWGIGKHDQDNGVLILVAVQERAMRIEVGYGLEGILPDGLAGALIHETFLPRFRDGDYPTGILQGTARVADIIRRNETLTPVQRSALDQAAADSGKSWGLAALLGLFIGAGAFSLGTAAGARVVVQMLFGASVTVGGLYLSTFVSPRAAVWLLTLFSLGVAAVGYVLGRRPRWRRSLRGHSRGGQHGWIAENTDRSSSSSSESSSSGSFGGGSSGGGGASGRW